MWEPKNVSEVLGHFGMGLGHMHRNTSRLWTGCATEKRQNTAKVLVIPIFGDPYGTLRGFFGDPWGLEGSPGDLWGPLGTCGDSPGALGDSSETDRRPFGDSSGILGDSSGTLW